MASGACEIGDGVELGCDSDGSMKATISDNYNYRTYLLVANNNMYDIIIG